MGNVQKTINHQINRGMSWLGNSPQPNSLTNLHLSTFRQDVKQLNIDLQDKAKCLGVLIHLLPDRITVDRYQSSHSLISGTIKSNESNAKDYPVILSVDEVYEMKKLLACFRISKQRKSRQSDMTPKKQEECVICFAATPSLVLPCAHSFCSDCTNLYIIEREVKLCPLCRSEYNCGRESLQRQIYEIIDEDEQLNKEIKTLVFDIIGRMNQRELKKVLVKPPANRQQQ